MYIFDNLSIDDMMTAVKRMEGEERAKAEAAAAAAKAAAEAAKAAQL